jgi:hypothetical protein
MKKEYSLLQSNNIRMTPNTVWFVDFAVSILYFDSNELPKNLQEICRKYQSSVSKLSPA